jgi:hypothetical protein
MSFYIVCQKKRNNPRMDVRICQKKCDVKDDCEDYVSYSENLVDNKNEPLPIKSQSVGLEVA